MTNATINWFPGHMVAARREATKALASVDVVIEVLDARCPAASANPMITEMRATRQRPALKVLNKSDVADAQTTAEWIAYFSAQPDTRAMAISTKNLSDVAKVVSTAQGLAPHRASFDKPLRLMTMGVPNVGKSTLINALLKRRSAAVGDEPAVTKAVRRYQLSDTVWLTDTPGLMWPKVEDRNAATWLAACHTIGSNAYYEDDVALALAEYLLRHYAALCSQRYGVAVDGLDEVQFIEAIAAKRGWNVGKANAGFERAAKALLVDFRTGAMGRISLERPAPVSVAP
jgi:ribosome biogenesis GTPase A